MFLTWRGRHGICVVGETYAQGHRRDLAQMIQFLHAQVTWMSDLIEEIDGKLEADLPSDHDIVVGTESGEVEQASTSLEDDRPNPSQPLPILQAIGGL